MAKSIENAISNSKSLSSEGRLKDENSLGERIKRNWSLQLLEIAIVFLPVLLVILGFRMAGIENAMLKIGGVWISYLFMLGLIWLSVRMRGETLKSIGLGIESYSLSSFGWDVLKSLAVLLFAVAGFLFGTILMANIVGIPEGADMSQYNYLSGNLPLLLISLLGVYFVSSFGEEVVFRGFLINRAQEMFGGNTRFAMIAALLLSSLVFGFAHFEWGATGIVQTTFMGAALGLSFLWTKKRLLPLVLAHCYMDTLLLVPLYFAPAS